MTTTRKKRPRDPVQLAKLIGDIATGQTPDAEDDGKDAAMSELGRQGGLKGGRARSESLTQEQRTEIATKAALSRWRR
jgi:hypothetical protein